MTESLKKIRLLSPLASPSWAGEAGDVIEIGESDAASLVARHQAEYVPSDAEDFIRLAKELNVSGVTTANEAVVSEARKAGIHVHRPKR